MNYKKKQKKNIFRIMIISALAVCTLAAVVIFCFIFNVFSGDNRIGTIAETTSVVAIETTSFNETETETETEAITEAEVVMIIPENVIEEEMDSSDITEGETETEEETTEAEPQGYLSGVRISAKKNAGLVKDQELIISDDQAVLKLDYNENMSKYTAVKLDIKAENGFVKLSGEGVNSDGTVNLTQEVLCTVTGKNGISRDYNISCKYGHELPVIYLTTGNGKDITSKYNYLAGTFSMDANGVKDFEDVPVTSMQIRGRGCSTWIRFPKKSYKIKFDEKISLMGKAKDKDWLLIANFHDRSLSRNDIALKLSKALTNIEFTPDSYPVDVFLNGQYLGEFDLCEQIEVAGGRVDIKTDETAVDSGFLLEFGGDNGNIYIGKLKFLEIKYPKQPTDEQRNYVIEYIKKVNKIITSGADLAALSEYVDIDSLVDWILLMEYTYNFDAAFERNVFVYKEPNGKLKFGPAWDFDLALGSLYCWDLEYQHYALSCNYMSGVTWATYLYDNKEFMSLMKARWIEVRDLLQDTAFDYIDEITPLLNASYEENYQRWMLPYEGKNIQWECKLEYTRRTLPEMMDYVKTILKYRYRFLNRVLLEGYRPEKHLPAEENTSGQNSSKPYSVEYFYSLGYSMTKVPVGTIPDETHPLTVSEDEPAESQLIESEQSETEIIETEIIETEIIETDIIETDIIETEIPTTINYDQLSGEEAIH